MFQLAPVTILTH